MFNFEFEKTEISNLQANLQANSNSNVQSNMQSIQPMIESLFDNTKVPHENSSYDMDDRTITFQVEGRPENHEARYVIYNQDYTLAEIIRHELLNDKRLEFVGTRKHHPLDKSVEIRIKLSKNNELKNIKNDDRKNDEQIMSELHETMKIATQNAKMECLMLKKELQKYNDKLNSNGTNSNSNGTYNGTNNDKGKEELYDLNNETKNDKSNNEMKNETKGLFNFF